MLYTMAVQGSEGSSSQRMHKPCFRMLVDARDRRDPKNIWGWSMREIYTH
jgi:hypothetical protein